MSALFSRIKKEFIPASRSLMPMQSPEKPPPMMRTSTVFSDAFEGGADDSLMLGSSSPCRCPRSLREPEGTRQLPVETGGLRESCAARAARHAELLARFLARLGRRQCERVRQTASNRPAE